ncbi:MAG: hypothetical protein QNL42_08085 [Flavobacteriaceae bacterium]|nr:esterase-like activity of phytase family protein [Flavobacteriaceae bacterium]MDB4112733.1 esterase-like activity of phytase family protein [Flavobacteriaceae bacterium]MDB9823652.1 esterase-like activity of phytase family protein [Flavobacteriaceae bacterium]
MEETSGLASSGEDFITHNDSGDDAKLYRINKLGELVNTYPIVGALNRDWEDLAQDDSLYYIADTGNNYGKRKDLTIYHVDKNFMLQDSIKIRYAKQDSFNKNKKTKYDAETLIAYGDSLLVFSKNRKSYNSQLYAFPKKAGQYSLTSLKKFKVNALITGGDYSAKSKRMALTGYLPNRSQYLLVADNFSLATIDDIEFKRYRLPLKQAQVEAVKILDNDSIWISSEGEGSAIPFLQKIDLNSLRQE